MAMEDMGTAKICTAVRNDLLKITAELHDQMMGSLPQDAMPTLPQLAEKLQ